MMSNWMGIDDKLEKARPKFVNSDGHDQIMIEFCSTMICSISLDDRVRRSDHDRAEHP